MSGPRRGCTNSMKFTEPFIYDEGVERCRELGAQPASVRSAAEDTWILEQSGKDIAQHTTFYIGLKFSFFNGSFYWLDGTAGTYRNWKSYAPLVSYGLCTEVERENGGRWDTARCHKEQPFLCSMPVMKP
ncbi:nattectin-like protein [Aphelenchoides avenae]|nr:nattectin-like protein [Aphelenchus avenae]